jgi:hypothetical protein
MNILMEMQCMKFQNGIAVVFLLLQYPVGNILSSEGHADLSMKEVTELLLNLSTILSSWTSIIYSGMPYIPKYYLKMIKENQK